MMRVWVLYTSGRDYRRVLTCVRVPVEWLSVWRARQIADGGRIVAVYRARYNPTGALKAIA